MRFLAHSLKNRSPFKQAAPVFLLVIFRRLYYKKDKKTAWVIFYWQEIRKQTAKK